MDKRTVNPDRQTICIALLSMLGLLVSVGIVTVLGFLNVLKFIGLIIAAVPAVILLLITTILTPIAIGLIIIESITILYYNVKALRMLCLTHKESLGLIVGSMICLLTAVSPLTIGIVVLKSFGLLALSPFLMTLLLISVGLVEIICYDSTSSKMKILQVHNRFKIVRIMKSSEETGHKTKITKS